jgi:hypothetical protein
VLVEGTSDKVAVEALAMRRGHDLVAAGVSVVPIGGAQAVRRFVQRYGGDVRVVGLCDAGEEADFRRALDDVYVCTADLEDELIRAVGPERVEQLLESYGDLRPFRTLQKQSAWHGRPLAQQLRRFMGSGGRRKIRYAQFLVDALDLERVPQPLDEVVAHAIPRGTDAHRRR